MTFVKTVIKINFQPFFDQDSLNFNNFPADITEAADLWADAINEYAKTVTPPSTTATVARQAFYATFLGMTNSNGDVILKAAFLQYATQLGLGMAGYTPTPPAVPINFSGVYSLGLSGEKNKDCLDLMVDIIDAWFKTGISVQISSGVSQPWT